MPTIDGIHFTDSGTGTASVVLVHGFTCDHTDWDRQIAYLSQNYRVIALDLPGHGQSITGEPSIAALGASVATLVHQLELVNTTLVGHSMGCRVVLEASRICGDRVKGIVFVDGSRAATTPAEYEALKHRLEGIEFSEFGASLFGQMFTEKTESDTRERIIARALGVDPEWARSLFVDMGHWDAHTLHITLATSELPMLVYQTTTIANAGDRQTLSSGEATAFTDYLKSMFNHDRSEIEVLPDTGHFPQFEEPDQLNTAIERMLRLAL